MSAIKSTISDWSGATVASANLTAHSSCSQHHITVSVSSSDSAGVMRLRLVPTGMTIPVAIKDDMERIDVAFIGGTQTFVISGFYSAIEAEFIEELTTGSATITVASTGQHLAALPVLGSESGSQHPPTTVITSGWDGNGMAGKAVPTHSSLAIHHIAVTCSTIPTTGEFVLQGRPSGSTKRVNIAGPFDLTVTGTANVVLVGFYDEFNLLPTEQIVNATSINARVASSGNDLNILPVIDSEIDSLISDINAALVLKNNDRVVAAAAKALTAQAIANATTVKADLASQLFDYGDFYDPSVSVFMPTTEGLYQFVCSVGYARSPAAAATAGKRTMAFIYKNGVAFKQHSSSTHDSANPSTCDVTGFVVANGVNDYFEMYARHETGHADMQLVTLETKMEMVRVGSAVEVEIIEMFSESDYGWWFTAGDFGRDMFEDYTGTNPAIALDDPIGLWLDKSGFENHVFQSIGMNRPLLKQSTTSGMYRAQFDGTDDSLSTV